MTIVMTSKHQITIPKKVTDALGLGKGAMFDVVVHRNRIELLPLEVKEKVFTDQDYAKLDALVRKEQGKEKPVSKKLISKLKK